MLHSMLLVSAGWLPGAKRVAVRVPLWRQHHAPTCSFLMGCTGSVSGVTSGSSSLCSGSGHQRQRQQQEGRKGTWRAIESAGMPDERRGLLLPILWQMAEIVQSGCGAPAPLPTWCPDRRGSRHRQHPSATPRHHSAPVREIGRARTPRCMGVGKDWKEGLSFCASEKAAAAAEECSLNCRLR